MERAAVVTTDSGGFTIGMARSIQKPSDESTRQAGRRYRIANYCQCFRTGKVSMQQQTQIEDEHEANLPHRATANTVITEPVIEDVRLEASSTEKLLSGLKWQSRWQKLFGWGASVLSL